MHVDFNLNGDYAAFIKSLREKFADNKEQAEKVAADPLTWNSRLALLPKQQRPATPARWMHIRLTVESHSVTLAVRDDNVYLIGFMNQRGRWYEFGFELPGRESANMIDRSGLDPRGPWVEEPTT